jgi:hypothetical protein
MLASALLLLASAQSIYARSEVPTQCCPSTYDPVCDPITGKQYPNACLAEFRHGIKNTTKCVAKSVDPNAVCPAISGPVCGSDGKTYGNECEAKKVGIVVMSQGACAECKSSLAKRSPALFPPICSNEGVVSHPFSKPR